MSNPEPQIQISLHQLTASPTRPPGAPYDLPQPVHLADIARGLNQNTISALFNDSPCHTLKKEVKKNIQTSRTE